MNDTFTPFNDFETILAKAQRGEVSTKELMAGLVTADLALPSAGSVQSDWSGFQPLLFSKNGVSMLACFSAKERLSEFVEMAPYCLVIKGRELLQRMPVGHGLVVNPGQRVGFDISPDGVAQVLADLAAGSVLASCNR